MKKYIPISNHDSDVDLSEPWEGCDSSKAVYLASEVDARIAELEQSISELREAFNAVCCRRDKLAARITDLENGLRDALSYVASNGGGWTTIDGRYMTSDDVLKHKSLMGS